MKLSFLFFLLATVTVDASSPRVNKFKLDEVAKSDAKLKLGGRSGSAVKAQKGGKSESLRVGAKDRQNWNFSAVYGMTNQPENEILIYSRNRGNGRLNYEGKVATGGSGIGQVGTAPGDPLGAQDPMVVAGECLLAVNAGSNTISTFEIKSASSISLVGTYDTNGSIPVSVAERNGLVYVLNAGGNGSVQGFYLSPECELTYPDHAVDLDQGGGDVSPGNPPNGLATPAEVGFTPDGNLLVLIKVDGGFQNFPSPGVASLNHYVVNDDGTLGVLTKTTIEDRPGSLPFAFDFDDEGRLLLVEVFNNGQPEEGNGSGAVTVWDLEANGSFTQLNTVDVGQIFACWIRFNPETKCAYTSNAGADGSLSALSAGPGGVYELDDSAAAGLNGPIDLIFSDDGRNLYVLSPGVGSPSQFGSGQPQIYVYNAERDCGLTERQTIADGYDPSFIADNGVAGLAIYPGNP